MTSASVEAHLNSNFGISLGCKGKCGTIIIGILFDLESDSVDRGLVSSGSHGGGGGSNHH